MSNLPRPVNVDSTVPAQLTVREAAKVIGLGKNKMYELTRRKGFPCIRDGWKIIIPRDALFRWLEEEAFRNTGEATQRA
ncbi:hypothetical protein AN477_19685 [Alicyclobacillus ferrooxydans]|uniref:Helix-turn-helix domain-containing protein n=2 Tax=Alicyclobacillus ferrooxydans TaxID=471514 RepID=A0A0P9GNM6_9BACL|nr:hypothetical protein AN477_19685 [Alicyclobacillus ferrooxydans]